MIIQAYTCLGTYDSPTSGKSSDLYFRRKHLKIDTRNVQIKSNNRYGNPQMSYRDEKCVVMHDVICTTSIIQNWDRKGTLYTTYQNVRNNHIFKELLHCTP